MIQGARPALAVKPPGRGGARSSPMSGAPDQPAPRVDPVASSALSAVG